MVVDMGTVTNMDFTDYHIHCVINNSYNVASFIMKKYLIYLPFLLIFLWCSKNYYYFNVFGISSWLPMSFYRMTTFQLPLNERIKLYETKVQGKSKLSIFSTQEPFGRLWRYDIPNRTGFTNRVKEYPRTPYRYIPVLDIAEIRNNNPNLNYNGSNMNHWMYLRICEQLQIDNMWVLNHYPRLFYFGSVPKAIRLCFTPAYKWFETDSVRMVNGKMMYTHRRAVNLDIMKGKLRWLNGNILLTK